MRISFVSILVLCGAMPILAQSAATSPGDRGARPGGDTSIDRMSNQSKKPYQSLFGLDQGRADGLRELVSTQRSQLTTKPAGDAPKEKIVCGLTVWNVGPEQDPRMVIRPPANGRVDLKIQKIAPTACAE